MVRPVLSLNSSRLRTGGILLAKIAFAFLAFWLISHHVAWHDHVQLNDGSTGYVILRTDDNIQIQTNAETVANFHPSQIARWDVGLRSLLKSLDASAWGMVLVVPTCASLLFWLRWHTLLRWNGAELDWAWSGSAWIRSQIAGLLPIGSVGADSYRIYAVRKVFDGVAIPLGIAAIERLAGLFALILIGAAGLCLQWKARMPSPALYVLLLSVVACFGVIVAFWVFEIWSRRDGSRLHGARQRIHTFIQPLEALVASPRRLLGVLGFSLLGQSGSVVAYLVVDRVMGWNTAPACYLIAVPVVTLAQMLPLHIGGVGIAELGIWYFLSLFTLRSASEAVMLTNVVRAANWASFAILGSIFWVAGRRNGSSVTTLAHGDPVMVTL